MNNIKIYNESCLENYKNEIEKNSVDLILADLPYGVTGYEWDKKLDIEKLNDLYNYALKPNGVLLLFAVPPFSFDLLKLKSFKFKYKWYWRKNTATGSQFSDYQPMRSIEEVLVFHKPTNNPDTFIKTRKYLDSQFDLLGMSKAELVKKYGNYTPQSCFKTAYSFGLPTKQIYTWLQSLNPELFKMPYDVLKSLYNSEKLTKTYNPQGVVIKANKEKTNRVMGSNKEYNCRSWKKTNTPKNVLEFKCVTNNERYHPTEKPIDLLAYLIKTYTNENQTVLDNTMGAGSTGVASLKCNRNFIGYEINKKYFDIAQERLDKETNKERMVKNE